MNSSAATFADEILAVESAAAMLSAANRDSSIELAKAAAGVGRKCPQIIIEAADLIERLGDPALALDLLGGGVSLDGPTAPFQLAYSRHCRKSGDLAAARTWLRGSMLRARPNAAMALALCEIELGLGDEAAATAMLNLAVQLRWIDNPGLRYAADRLIETGHGDVAAVAVMMMHLRAKGDLGLRRELAALIRAHAPFDRLPDMVRSRLRLADPATYSDIAPVVANETGHEYTNSWFLTSAKATWDQMLPQINPTRILEVGSFEGASTCYLIDMLACEKSIEVHCVDTWEGGVEHNEGGSARTDMHDVERRFLRNTQLSIEKASHRVDLRVHKGRSDIELSRLIAHGLQGYFDFIYIDGSHQAPDVLCDAVLGFRLLRENGVMIFDDYLWQESLPQGVDPIRCPKPAIDAFVNLYCRKVTVLPALLYQLHVRKLTD